MRPQIEEARDGRGFRITTVEDYAPHIGEEAVERILGKARRLADASVTNINATYYGGGVAELLSSLTLLMNAAGIRTGWRVIQGRQDFFNITKRFHNGLQGGPGAPTEAERRVYEEVVFENAVRNNLDHDFVVVHDPQPLPLVEHFRRRGPWIWQCHVELSAPDRGLWQYLSRFVEQYDAVVLSSQGYRQDLAIPQLFLPPAIDPFSMKNCELPDEVINERLEAYRIPTDLPLVVQISRFDRWKDPEGVLKAFKVARKQVEATLVLVGNFAADDPEGQQVFESLLGHQEERVLILAAQDTLLVNALQRRAAVVLQKSLREGFGLTVAEAMWKGTPVIAGNAGGLPLQIEDRVNGFLVSSIEETADRIVTLLKDADLRRQFGERGREAVRTKFLMPRLLEDYLDLFSAFQANFVLPGAGG